MHDITELFDSLLEQTGSIDMAESDFKRMLVDDSSLRRRYKEWGMENDTTERSGFLAFCKDRLERQDAGWGIFQEDEDL